MTKQEMLKTKIEETFYIANVDKVEQMKYLGYNAASDLFIFDNDYDYESYYVYFAEIELRNVFKTKKDCELHILNEKKSFIEKKIAELLEKE